MDTSIFTFIMSLFWCSVFILFSTILRHKKGFVLKYGVNFILLIMIVGIVRLFIPVEPHFSVVIGSTSVMPFLQQYLRTNIFQIGDYPINRFDVFISIWVVGSIVYLTGIIVGILRINRRIYKISDEDNTQAQRIMREIVLESKPKQKYRIIVSDEIDTPMLVGYFVPKILIPSLSLTDDEIRFVLTHEWNHFLHKHLWTKLLFNVLCALLWWNPLVYLVKEDLDYILEVNCDRLVVSGLGDAERIKYVEATTKVIKQLTNTKPRLSLSSIGFIATDSAKIVQRCELLLFPPKGFSKRTQCALGTAILVLVAISYVFIVQPFIPPPLETGIDYIKITPDNSYLVSNEDDTYDLYLNGEFLSKINKDEMSSLPYSNLPIKTDEEKLK